MWMSKMVVSQDHLGDDGEKVYRALWSFLLEKQREFRRPIPDFQQFLMACHKGKQPHQLLAEMGFDLSRQEVRATLRPVGKSLRKILRARPLLVPRRLGF